MDSPKSILLDNLKKLIETISNIDENTFKLNDDKFFDFNTNIEELIEDTQKFIIIDFINYIYKYTIS